MGGGAGGSDSVGRRNDLEDASEALEDSPDGYVSGCEPESADCGSCDCAPLDRRRNTDFPGIVAM